jgi:hypothetical protein
MMLFVLEEVLVFVRDKSRERIYTERPDEKTLSPEELASLKGMARWAFKIELLLSVIIGR